MTDYETASEDQATNDANSDGDTLEGVDAYENNDSSTVQVPLVWRLVAIVVAAVVIIVLLLPAFNRSTEDPPGSPDNAAEPAAITETPPETLFQQGQAYYQAGQWDQAIATYQQLIELDPEYQSAYVNLGDAYYQRNQLDLAVEAYQKAIDLDPEDADVAYNLGAAYLQQALSVEGGDQAGIEKAIEQIEHAIKLNPELPHPYYGLGAAYHILGDNTQAIENYEKFLELDDGSDERATSTAQQTLEQLKAAPGQ